MPPIAKVVYPVQPHLRWDVGATMCGCNHPPPWRATMRPGDGHDAPWPGEIGEDPALWAVDNITTLCYDDTGANTTPQGAPAP